MPVRKLSLRLIICIAAALWLGCKRSHTSTSFVGSPGQVGQQATAPPCRSRIIQRLARGGNDEEVEALLTQAMELERDRSELLLSQLDILDADVEERVPQDAIDEVKQLLQMATSGGTGKLYKPLQASNNRLQESINKASRASSEPEEEEAKPSSLPSFLPKWAKTRLAGMDVNVDEIPPVVASDEAAVIAQAAIVRVTMPLGDLGGFNELLWGADVTPFYDDEGDRLMVFTVPFSLGPYPVGLKFSNEPRPEEAPIGQGNTVRVESVLEGSDADKAGIKAGDYLRAFSYMKDPPEPSFIDNILGSTGPEAPLKAVHKCDAWEVDAVEKALLTNKVSPDREITLLLERPL
mmetsp:Transcript_62455/g.116003  ORF Transcript_62455/g.116003 Transcript_62455/m.116003 type:complete len:350 (-) Transcript_62455:56-1105(-)